jgi:hypothetical protein
MEREAVRIAPTKDGDEQESEIVPVRRRNMSAASEFVAQAFASNYIARGADGGRVRAGIRRVAASALPGAAAARSDPLGVRHLGVKPANEIQAAT